MPRSILPLTDRSVRRRREPVVSMRAQPYLPPVLNATAGQSCPAEGVPIDDCDIMRSALVGHVAGASLKRKSGQPRTSLVVTSTTEV